MSACCRTRALLSAGRPPQPQRDTAAELAAAACCSCAFCLLSEQLSHTPETAHAGRAALHPLTSAACPLLGCRSIHRLLQAGESPPAPRLLRGSSAPLVPSARSLAELSTPPGPRGLCGQRCGRWRAPRALTRVRRGFAPLTSMLGSDARHPTGPHHAAPTLSAVLASPPGPPLFSAAPPPAATAAARRPPPPPPPPPSSGIYGTPPDGPHPTAGPPRTRRRDCSPTPLRCAEATTARPPPVGPACCDGWAGGGSLHAPTCLSGELAARWVRAARALEPPVARARRAAPAAPRPPRLFRGSRACGSDLSHAGALRPLVVVAGDVGAGKRALLTPRGSRGRGARCSRCSARRGRSAWGARARGSAQAPALSLARHYAQRACLSVPGRAHMWGGLYRV